MIWMLVGAFIAFPHFLDFNDFDLDAPVEQDAVVADAQAVAVLVVRQCLDVLAVWHCRQGANAIANHRLVLAVNFAQLPSSAERREGQECVSTCRSRSSLYP